MLDIVYRYKKQLVQMSDEECLSDDFAFQVFALYRGYI